MTANNLDRSGDDDVLIEGGESDFERRNVFSRLCSTNVKSTLSLTGLFVILLFSVTVTLIFVERAFFVENIVGENVVISLKKVREFHSSLTRSSTKEQLFLMKQIAELRCELKMDQFELRWDFDGSLDYVISVLSTVGYGAITPHSKEGRFVTAVYILFGIPIMGIFLKATIDILQHMLTKWYHINWDCFHQTHKFYSRLVSSTGLVTILFVVTILLALLARVRMTDHNLTLPDYAAEHWSVYDAFWFQMISLSSVGLGDLHHKSHGAGFVLCQTLFVFLPICFAIGLQVIMVSYLSGRIYQKQYKEIKQ